MWLGLQREFCEEFRRKAKQVFGGPACDTILPDGWTFPGEHWQEMTTEGPCLIHHQPHLTHPHFRSSNIRSCKPTICQWQISLMVICLNRHSKNTKLISATTKMSSTHQQLRSGHGSRKCSLQKKCGATRRLVNDRENRAILCIITCFVE